MSFSRPFYILIIEQEYDMGPAAWLTCIISCPNLFVIHLSLIDWYGVSINNQCIEFSWKRKDQFHFYHAHYMEFKYILDVFHTVHYCSLIIDYYFRSLPCFKPCYESVGKNKICSCWIHIYILNFTVYY